MIGTARVVCGNCNGNF